MLTGPWISQEYVFGLVFNISGFMFPGPCLGSPAKDLLIIRNVPTRGVPARRVPQLVAHMAPTT